MSCVMSLIGHRIQLRVLCAVFQPSSSEKKKQPYGGNRLFRALTEHSIFFSREIATEHGDVLLVRSSLAASTKR